MTKYLFTIICLIICLSSFAQEEEKMKYRKLDYTDFRKLSINDTSQVIIDLFFDKKDNAGVGQMTFLPITLVIYPVSPVISGALTLVSLPLFINGSYMMVKYRKKKLYMVLTEYSDSGELPKWVRKKANKQLKYVELLKREYQQ
ncbi:MAG: hypothetical protein ACPGSO_04810 [Vicingaceae bacterium]